MNFSSKSDESLRKQLDSCMVKVTVDCGVFNYRIVKLWGNIIRIFNEIAYHASEEGVNRNSFQGEASSNAQLDKLNDVMKVAERFILKACSCKNLADSILKRNKFLAELKGIEGQLCSVLQGMGMHNLECSASLMVCNEMVDEYDLLQSRDLLLDIQCVIDLVHVQNPAYREHMDSIVTLIDFLNKQMAQQAVFLPLQAFSDMTPFSMKWMTALREGSTIIFHATEGEDTAASSYWLPAADLNTGGDRDGTQTSSAAADSTNGAAGPDEGACGSAGYQYSSTVSEVGFGVMHRCVWRGALVAAKKVEAKSFLRGTLGLRDALNLVQCNSEKIKKSPFLASLLAVSFDPDGTAVLLSQLAPERSLYDVLLNPRINPASKVKISPAMKASILLDVCCGVQHLHSCGVVHGRIKDANVLLWEGYRAKLCDFGMSPFLTAESQHEAKGTDGLRWTAPEVVQAEAANKMLHLHAHGVAPAASIGTADAGAASTGGAEGCWLLLLLREVPLMLVTPTLQIQSVKSQCLTERSR